MAKRVAWQIWLVLFIVLAVATYSIVIIQWLDEFSVLRHLLPEQLPVFLREHSNIITAASGETVTATGLGTYQLFLPMVVLPFNEQATGELRFVDETNRFSFSYPARFAQSPLKEQQCDMVLHPAQGDGWGIAEDGDHLLTFGLGIQVQTKPAYGRPLAQFVDQFVAELGEIQFGSRDDERFDRVPRGYVVEASYQHHYNPHVFFQQDDTIYIFQARMSQACIDETAGVTMENAFWQAVESFRFSH